MAINIHGSSYLIGHPDILGSYKGLPFAIETKIPGKHLSKVQESVRRKWIASGTYYFVVKTWGEYTEFCMTMETQAEDRDLSMGMEVSRDWE